MINRAVLVGRLTKDPDYRKTTGGISKTQFTLACDRIGEGADFISCVAWRQPADFLGMHGKKGNMVGVDGRISTRTYEKDGRTVYVTEVTADNVRLLSGKNEGESTRTETPQEQPENEPWSVTYAPEELPF